MRCAVIQLLRYTNLSNINILIYIYHCKHNGRWYVRMVSLLFAFYVRPNSFHLIFFHFYIKCYLLNYLRCFFCIDKTSQALQNIIESADIVRASYYGTVNTWSKEQRKLFNIMRKLEKMTKKNTEENIILHQQLQAETVKKETAEQDRKSVV